MLTEQAKAKARLSQQTTDQAASQFAKKPSQRYQRYHPVFKDWYFIKKPIVESEKWQQRKRIDEKRLLGPETKQDELATQYGACQNKSIAAPKMVLEGRPRLVAMSDL